jgi:hypothetical protein
MLECDPGPGGSSAITGDEIDHREVMGAWRNGRWGLSHWSARPHRQQADNCCS